MLPRSIPGPVLDFSNIFQGTIGLPGLSIRVKYIFITTQTGVNILLEPECVLQYKDINK